MYTNISGTRIHYLVEGDGVPCMIASLAGTPIYERTFSANLRRHLKMIFVEPRGNRSDIGDPAGLTLDRIVDDLDQLRGELNLERIAVLGHSVNAFIALRYAARHPDHVSHVIVIGGIPTMDASSAQEQEKYWTMLASQERKGILLRNSERVKDALSKATPDDAIIIKYIANGPLYWYDARFDCTDLWKGHSCSAEIFERFVGPGGECSKIDPTIEFPKVRCPVLGTSGVFDFAAVPTAWHKFKDLLANHSYRAFEKSGHWPHFEEQSMFDATLLEWLKRS
jgi:proline iminopeptidase